MKSLIRGRRAKRVRAKVSGTKERPRLSVFRSAKHIYAQIINDEKGITLASFSDNNLGKKDKDAKGVEVAELVGGELAKLALKKKVTKIVFDKSGYTYHGRVEALANGARKGGLNF